MKKYIISSLLCVFFVLLTFSVGNVYAFDDEILEFYYNNKVFIYKLSENIKQSTQFDINLKVNKYNRFGGYENRKELLEHMVEIGVEKEIALNYLFPNLNELISKMEKQINRVPQNATLKILPNTEKVFHITTEKTGITLNRIDLYNQIYTNYLVNKPLNFKIKTILSSPKLCRNDYEKFSHLRSDFSTNISSSSSDRKHNIKNALTTLNKTEIYPNQIFSFNKTIGKRTPENGYRQAKIIVNNEYVEGFGGGVCQVSSTLYNSALLAGLEIVEANKHSKQIGYVKYGFDAMVNFGSSDLKFKNNTNEKLTIITNYSENDIRIRIFGEDLKQTTFKLKNEILNVVEPVDEIVFDTNFEHIDKVVYEDEYFYLTKPSKGMTVKSYREEYLNNQLVNTELLRTDKFNVQNAKIVYGTKKREDYSFSLIGWITSK